MAHCLEEYIDLPIKTLNTDDNNCMGLTWAYLVSRGLQGHLCEQSPAAAPRQIRDISKKLQNRPTTARAEPISNTQCTSGRADLREKRTGVQQQLRKKSEKYERSSPAACKVGAKVGQEVLQA